MIHVRLSIEAEEREAKRSLARGSGDADPLVSELRSLATTEYPLCPEARLLLEMAVEAQQGKPKDVTRLLANADLRQDADSAASNAK